MGPAGVTNKERKFFYQLTCPKFHFETETKIDSLTGVQQYKDHYVLNECLQYSQVLPWTLNSQGNNFQLEMRLRFFSR